MKRTLAVTAAVLAVALAGSAKGFAAESAAGEAVTATASAHCPIVAAAAEVQASATAVSEVLAASERVQVQATSGQVQAGTPIQVTGTVKDTDGKPLAYATVAAMSGDRQAAGTVTDEQGVFTLALAGGEYIISFDFLGYATIERALTVAATAAETPVEMGVTVLEAEVTEIEGIEVTAQLIRREADRFVVDVANTPAATGKDGVELLQSSPGVYITDNNLTINGKSGTKVYIDEREVRYSGDRLLDYLRNIKSDEVQKIEIIPIAGADKDADSSGGIIMITLRQRREDGVMGNISFRTSHGEVQHVYGPSFDIDYRTGKWTLSGRGYYSCSTDRMTTSDRTHYTFSSNELSSDSRNKQLYSWYGGKAGAVYEINDRHSVGAEVEYGHFGDKTETLSGSVFRDAAAAMTHSTDDRYKQHSGSDTFTARFNYIAKLDSLGSTLKILADFTHHESASGNDYFTSKTTAPDNAAALLRDSLYRDNSGTNYNITTAGADFRKVFSAKFSLSSGVKFTNNLMKSFSRYELQQAGEWVKRQGDYDFDVNYSENIAALYVTGNAQLGRWSLSAGLRGEYTFTGGRDDAVRQNYFSLFPNAAAAFGLKKDMSYMLTAQYARTIRRPNFWALNPARSQVSEYIYQMGNPDLQPQFSNDISLSVIMKYKYSITLGVRTVKNDINQRMAADKENPDISVVLTDNIDRTEMYYTSVNLPFQLTKWWTLNANMTGGYNGIRIEKGEKQVFHPILMGNASTTFTLPLGFHLTLDYYGMSRMYISNISARSRHWLGVTVKKQLFKERLSLSAGANNILPPYNLHYTYTDKTFVRNVKISQGWNKPTFVFYVSYNFNRGKSFVKKSIESSADTQRLSKQQ